VPRTKLTLLPILSRSRVGHVFVLTHNYRAANERLAPFLSARLVRLSGNLGMKEARQF